MEVAYRKLNLTNFLVSNAKKIGFTVEKFLILINEPYIFNQNICHTRLLISSTTRTCSILKILKKFKIYRDNFCPFPFLYLLHTFVSHSSKLLILDGKAFGKEFHCTQFWASLRNSLQFRKYLIFSFFEIIAQSAQWNGASVSIHSAQF